MRGLASIILFLALAGSFASKGILPISRATSPAHRETDTTTTSDSLPTKEPGLVCNNNEKDLAIQEAQLVEQIEQIKESTNVSLGELKRINQEMQQDSLKDDNANEALQKIARWNDTIKNLQQRLVNENEDSPIDVSVSQSPRPEVTVAFNPEAIVSNLQRGFEQVSPSDVANWAANTSQTVARAAEQISSQSADSVSQLEKQLDSIRANCNTLPQANNTIPQADENYTYHSAQPDPNLPPVQVISCDDPQVVSNPKHVCEISPGVVRMPRLD